MKNTRGVIFALISGLAFIIVFAGTLIYFLFSFKNNGEIKKITIDSTIQSGIANSHMMASYGETYLATVVNTETLNLYSAIKYDTQNDRYILYGSMLGYDFGTLSGNGPIATDGIEKNELILALNYGDVFKELYKHISSTAWIYYTSEKDFIMIYPQADDGFIYTDILKKTDFYTAALPENDPQREPVWSDVYTDEAGKGNMVTISCPVYLSDKFMGVVSIDYTTSDLGRMLSDRYDCFLVDVQGNIIADGNNKYVTGSVHTLSRMLNLTEASINRIRNAENGKVHLANGKLLYTYKFDFAPWMLVMTLPIYYTVLISLIFSSPVIATCLLLMHTHAESEKIKKAEREIREIAVTDKLTGLKNRYYLDIFTDREFQLNDRNNQHLSLITFDLDHFKKVNDTYGHETGDEVLKQTACIAQSNIRKTDILARTGGEEFLILLPDADIDAAFRIAEKIRRALEDTPHPSAGVCTASFGVAERFRGETYSNLFRRADEALYRAKDSGRNRVLMDDGLGNSLKIKWNNSWRSGNEDIDAQHKELIDLGNTVLSAVISNMELNEIKRLLNEFVLRLNAHFKYEDNLLEELSYPESEKHKAIHIALRKKAADIVDTVREGSGVETKIVAYIINDVLVNHILVDDVDYYTFITGKQPVHV